LSTLLLLEGMTEIDCNNNVTLADVSVFIIRPISSKSSALTSFPRLSFDVDVEVLQSIKK